MPRVHRVTGLVAPVLLAVPAMLALPVRAEAPATQSRESTAVAPSQQYLYVLRLVPRLHDDAAWTEADSAAVSRHFAYLKQATATGRVILAGRTREPGERTFGLVIFEAATDDEAQRFMTADPAVVAGVMTATLHPYDVALRRER